MSNLKCLFTQFPWDIFLFWLIPLLLLWWYMYSRTKRYRTHISELQNRINFLEGELEACRKNKKSSIGDGAGSGDVNKIQADLDACLKARADLEGRIAKMAGESMKASTGAGVAAASSIAATGGSGSAGGGSGSAAGAAKSSGSGKKDDLKIVEGIGPKISSLFNAEGIYTFADLASAKVETLKKILHDAGPRFQMHDPTTWPDQAALARDGKFDELKKWQDELNKGKI